MSSADPVPPTTSPAGFLEASWSPEALAERGGRGAVKSLWRVLATTWHGIIAHRLPQQSAALTYYTLMSLGPLLGLALTVSGFILSRGAPEDNPAKRAIVAAVEYAAPQIVAKASTPDHHATLREINKDLDALVDRLLQTAASGEAGVIGLLLILGLAVLMLSRVEDALNGIWGVRFGRSWRDRFANYLLFLVLFFLVGATNAVASNHARHAHKIARTFLSLGYAICIFAIRGARQNSPLVLNDGLHHLNGAACGRVVRASSHQLHNFTAANFGALHALVHNFIGQQH